MKKYRLFGSTVLLCGRKAGFGTAGFNSTTSFNSTNDAGFKTSTFVTSTWSTSQPPLPPEDFFSDFSPIFYPEHRHPYRQISSFH